jgi:multidrug efflux pump subunit AcrB
MPEDIFPEINIPVVSVIWKYTGLSVSEMEQRVTTYCQYTISSSVTGIKNMEVQTVNGISLQKIYFQPNVNLDPAIAQMVSAQCDAREHHTDQTALRAYPDEPVHPPIAAAQR